MSNFVVFTDLDGTLLDAHTYSAEPARSTLTELKSRGVPVVFCTSKTRAEVLALREDLGNEDPFIVENGGGVFVPEGLFREDLEARGFSSAGGGLLGLAVGAPYERLRSTLETLVAEGFRVRGFGDMSDDEVAQLVGLPRDAARLARQREFDEPFVLEEGESREDAIVARIRALGLHHTSGRLHHVLGDNDKGRALRLVHGLYELERGQSLRTVALGDSPNDVPMLLVADHPVLIRRPEGDWHPRVLDELAGEPALERLVRTQGAGPRGWAEVLGQLLAEEH